MPRRILIVALLLIAVGCADTRSISNAGGRYENPFYHGELDEFAVLGIDPTERITEADIQSAAAVTDPVRLEMGSRVLLLQSGAPFPDDPMKRAFEAHYEVTPFNGSPVEEAGAGYSRALRLVAAKGDQDAIVAYWGMLESARSDLATKGVSWIPIVGPMIPDEAQQMRIRLKFVVMDVRTGRWTSFTTRPGKSLSVSNKLGRKDDDAEQVDELKEAGYPKAVAEFVARFGG